MFNHHVINTDKIIVLWSICRVE